MSLTTLGRRYERLLFLSAPLSLGSILTLFVVFATNSQAERSTARCYESAASLLEVGRPTLEDAWKELSTKKRSPSAQIEYTYTVRKMLIDVSLGKACWTLLLSEAERRTRFAPIELISTLREDAKRLLAIPVKYSGVEIPEKATIGLLGTKVSIDLKLFILLLQVVLAPLLLLWLGSLYNTRYRESLLIGEAKRVTEVFPHLVNVYPAVRYPEPRRRSYVQPYLSHVFGLMYALTRIALLSLFVGPPVGTYIAGVLIGNEQPYATVFYASAALVGIFWLALVLCELFPWHYGKTFPGPPLLAQRP